jgi:hypothetical protein
VSAAGSDGNPTCQSKDRNRSVILAPAPWRAIDSHCKWRNLRQTRKQQELRVKEAAEAKSKQRNSVIDDYLEGNIRMNKIRN